MNKLIEQLLEFQDSRRNKGVGLEKLFEKLAKYLLYGGHFHCSERYDLYITSVEFYYHEEIGDNDKRIVDPIMYHRNVKDKPVVPYLNVGTLYPHWSGVDITFEDDILQYRASALIRSYRIVQLKPERLELKESDLSTYVYDYLFDGLSVDKKETANMPGSNVIGLTRKEHFVAHHLLKKIYEQSKNKDAANAMNYTFRMMCGLARN